MTLFELNDAARLGMPKANHDHTFTREDAILAYDAILQARTLMVAEANRLTRKRSMSSNDLQQHSRLCAALDNLRPLEEYIGTQFSVGGW